VKEESNLKVLTPGSTLDSECDVRGPQRGAVILRFLGFGVVRLIGVNPDQVRVRDIAVEVVHSGFYTSARVWLRIADGARGWAWTAELQDNFYFTSYLA
jgi:hypothetical protein